MAFYWAVLEGDAQTVRSEGHLFDVCSGAGSGSGFMSSLELPLARFHRWHSLELA